MLVSQLNASEPTNATLTQTSTSPSSDSTRDTARSIAS